MWNPFKKKQLERDLKLEEVEKLLHAYGELLQDQGAPFMSDASVLPASKSRLKKALLTAIALEKDAEKREGYKVAYLCLTNCQAGIGPDGVEPVPEDVENLTREELLAAADKIDSSIKWLRIMEAEAQTLRQELREFERRLNLR